MPPKPPKPSGPTSLPVTHRQPGEAPSRQPGKAPATTPHLPIPGHAQPPVARDARTAPIPPPRPAASLKVTDLPASSGLAPVPRQDALQRYARIAPKALAPADANGLRRHHQQAFVELDHQADWVVQVEYDASVGAFRAKLRNELLPSGPALYRVTGSAKWSTRRPTPPIERYLIPEHHRANLELLRAYSGAMTREYVGPWSNDSTTATKQLFKERQDLLRQDATRYFHQARLPARPSTDPGLLLATSAEQFFSRFYARYPGLVLGEIHAEIGPKQLLIENMPVLVRQGVNTLYLEHLRTDFEQPALDAYQRAATMPQSLKDYLEVLDEGHRTDPSGTHGFLALVSAARAHGIRIIATDCAASYIMNSLDTTLHRNLVMNYYAERVITTDAAGRAGGKWIALVGSAHTHAQQGCPGLAELLGVPGIRIADLEDGAPLTVTTDPGQSNIKISRGATFVKADLLLHVGVPPYGALRRDGHFFIYRHPDKRTLQLVHRHERKALRSPIVETPDKRFQLERSPWPELQGERFTSLGELSATLVERHAMVEVLPVERPMASPNLQRPLVNRGNFLIETRADEQLQLRHHSMAGVIVETPIVQDAKGFALAGERWAIMNGRSFATLDALRAALVSEVGLSPVAD